MKKLITKSLVGLFVLMTSTLLLAACNSSANNPIIIDPNDPESPPPRYSGDPVIPDPRFVDSDPTHDEFGNPLNSFTEDEDVVTQPPIDEGRQDEVSQPNSTIDHDSWPATFGGVDDPPTPIAVFNEALAERGFNFQPAGAMAWFNGSLIVALETNATGQWGYTISEVSAPNRVFEMIPNIGPIVSIHQDPATGNAMSWMLAVTMWAMLADINDLTTLEQLFETDDLLLAVGQLVYR